MRAELYRGLCLLLILIMLFTIQPAAFGEEEVLLEEPVESPESVPETDVTAEELLLTPEETPTEDEEHELWIENTEAYEAAEKAADGNVRFSGCGLVLSDRIGLAFHVDVPEALRDGAYMRFEGSGIDRRFEIPDAADEHGLYRFICWLSPLELAREVTPVFCREELSIPGEAASVRGFIEAEGEDSDRYSLLTALGNYGHFAELCFGSAEAEMPRYGDEDYDYDAICAALSDQEMQWTSAGRIAQAVPLIRVEPDFRLMMSFGMPDSAAEAFEVTVYGAVIEPDENACYPLAAVYVNGFGTRLDVDIKDAGAHASLKLSALSVAREALDPKGSCTPEQKDFCAALYTLYEAVKSWNAV